MKPVKLRRAVANNFPFVTVSFTALVYTLLIVGYAENYRVVINCYSAGLDSTISIFLNKRGHVFPLVAEKLTLMN